MSTRTYRVLLVAAFCALLCVPGTSMLFGAEAPRLYGVKDVPYPTFRPAASWLADFEAYFVANLGQKRRLVQLHNWLGYKLLGDLQSDTVLVGKHDWLFLKQNYGWESFRSEEPLRRSTANAWKRSLSGAKRWLSRRGIRFLFIIVPSKERIYPEFLPASATRARQLTRLDEMLPVLRQAKVDFIDLREPLLAARRDGWIYDSIDSHWNGRGAQVGTELLLRRTAELLDRPAAYAELGAKLVPQASWADIPLLLSLDGIVTEPSVALVAKTPRAQRIEPPASVRQPTRKQASRMVFEVPDESLPKALILRDSFADIFMEAFAEKFQRSVWIWTHDLDLRSVSREDPDIVIVEMTERFFSGAPPRLMTGGKR